VRSALTLGQLKKKREYESVSFKTIIRRPAVHNDWICKETGRQMQDTSSSGQGEKGARVEGDEALEERRCGNCGENTVRSCLKDNGAMIYSYNFREL
jgi:hypothetical protein